MNGEQLSLDTSHQLYFKGSATGRCAGRTKKLAIAASLLFVCLLVGVVYLVRGSLGTDRGLHNSPDEEAEIADLYRRAVEFRAADRHDDSIPLFEKVRDLQIKRNGSDHPATLG